MQNIHISRLERNCCQFPLCWRMSKGKAIPLDGQVANPWPLSSTLKSLTSVCFSRLLPLLSLPRLLSSKEFYNGGRRGGAVVSKKTGFFYTKKLLWKWSDCKSSNRLWQKKSSIPLTQLCLGRCYMYMCTSKKLWIIRVCFLKKNLIYLFCLENRSVGDDITV